jgi:hypothetical protein
VPIELTQLKTRSGHPVLRVNFRAEVTTFEAGEFLRKVARGGEFFGYGHLIVGEVESLSGAVRKVLTSEKAKPTNPTPIAMVMASALTRMIATLAMRLTDNENNEFFKNESEALEWLEARMVEYVAKGGTQTA